ncbi:MAG TPA: hypothetical protein VFT55_01065 [Planctomycetota bacterium]|nr:hypothetical protein [Planctomycetota bacterium]
MAGEYASLLVAVVTLVLWLFATFLTRPEPREHLMAFYRKIRPDGPGWGPIAVAAPDARPDGTLGRNLVCAVLGTIVIWLTLPGVGNVIFGEYLQALFCLGGAAAAGVLLMRLVRHIAAAEPVRG